MARANIQCTSANTVKFPEYESEDPLVFELFNEASSDDYGGIYAQMMHIGALALMEDRIHYLISRTENETFEKLERFKLMFERRRIEESSTKKGDAAEVDVKVELEKYVNAQGWGENILKKGGASGSIKGNKTGDVVAVLPFTEAVIDFGKTKKEDGEYNVGIEVKIDKSIKYGDPETEEVGKSKPDDKGENIMGSDFDTAWSQLLETKLNRDSPFSIMVFDESATNASITKEVRDIRYLPGIPGFAVLIDKNAGRFQNLFIAYRMAREMAMYHLRDELSVEPQLLELIVKRIMHYLKDAEDVSNTVRAHVTATVKMNSKVQRRLKHLIHHSEYMFEFLTEYLESKELDPRRLVELYYAHPVAEELRKVEGENKELEKEIIALAESMSEEPTLEDDGDEK